MIIMEGINKIRRSTNIRQRRIFHVVLLMLVGAAVYSNSLNIPFILDDHDNIYWISKQRLLDHLLHGSMRRVTDITIAMNYQIHGMQVAGYHLVNLAIHLFTSIFLYFMIVSAVSALRLSYSANKNTLEEASLVEQFLPFTIALLFVVHPVQTQAVTYIIQRYASMATCFYLLSALLYIRARLAYERNEECLKSWFLGGSAFVAGVLALGSKQIAVTLPLMLLILEFFLFRGHMFKRRFFIVCGALFSILLVVLLFKWHGSSLDDVLNDLSHATTEAQFFSRTSYFLTQTRVVVTYLRLLFMPIDLSLMRDSPIYATLFSVPVLASLALHILLVGIAAILFRMSGQNLLSHDWLRGVFQRLASLGIFWFYIALSVESSFIPIRDVIFEHRTYLPSVGFFMTIIALTALAVQRSRTGVKAAWIVVSIIGLLLGSMTVARNEVWKDPLTLWQDCVSKSPNQWLALANLALIYNHRNMPEKALPLFVRAIEIQPAVPVQVRAGLGNSLKGLNIDEARFTTGQEFLLPAGEDGIAREDFSKYSKYGGVFCNNMGLAYEYLGEPVKARESYKNAVKLDPSYDLAWYNQALFAARINDKLTLDKALFHLKRLNPSLALAVNMTMPAQ